MKKSVLELTDKDVIHAETEQQVNELCKLFDRLGLTWSNGKNYLEDNYWNEFNEKTCYLPKDGEYGNLYCYNYKGFTIHKATDFISVDEVDIKEISTPEYYDNSKGYDVIDIANDYKLNFNRGSAIKYICRAGKKDDEIKDLHKAIDFLQREIKFLQLKNK